MNAAQAASFEEGTGDFFTAAELLWTFQAIGATAVFVYCAWVVYRAYENYGAEEIGANDMVIVWCRAVFVMMILLYLLVQN